MAKLKVYEKDSNGDKILVEEIELDNTANSVTLSGGKVVEIKGDSSKVEIGNICAEDASFIISSERHYVEEKEVNRTIDTRAKRLKGAASTKYTNFTEATLPCNGQVNELNVGICSKDGQSYGTDYVETLDDGTEVDYNKDSLLEAVLRTLQNYKNNNSIPTKFSVGETHKDMIFPISAGIAAAVAAESELNSREIIGTYYNSYDSSFQKNGIVIEGTTVTFLSKENFELYIVVCGIYEDIFDVSLTHLVCHIPNYKSSLIKPNFELWKAEAIKYNPDGQNYHRDHFYRMDPNFLKNNLHPSDWFDTNGDTIKNNQYNHRNTPPVDWTTNYSDQNSKLDRIVAHNVALPFTRNIFYSWSSILSEYKEFYLGFESIILDLPEISLKDDYLRETKDYTIIQKQEVIQQLYRRESEDFVHLVRLLSESSVINHLSLKTPDGYTTNPLIIEYNRSGSALNINIEHNTIPFSAYMIGMTSLDDFSDYHIRDIFFHRLHKLSDSSLFSIPVLHSLLKALNGYFGSEPEHKDKYFAIGDEYQTMHNADDMNEIELEDIDGLTPLVHTGKVNSLSTNIKLNPSINSDFLPAYWYLQQVIAPSGTIGDDIPSCSTMTIDDSAKSTLNVDYTDDVFGRWSVRNDSISKNFNYSVGLKVNVIDTTPTDGKDPADKDIQQDYMPDDTKGTTLPSADSINDTINIIGTARNSNKSTTITTPQATFDFSNDKVTVHPIDSINGYPASFQDSSKAGLDTDHSKLKKLEDNELEVADKLNEDSNVEELISTKSPSELKNPFIKENYNSYFETTLVTWTGFDNDLTYIKDNGILAYYWKENMTSIYALNIYMQETDSTKFKKKITESCVYDEFYNSLSVLDKQFMDVYFQVHELLSGAWKKLAVASRFTADQIIHKSFFTDDMNVNAVRRDIDNTDPLEYITIAFFFDLNTTDNFNPPNGNTFPATTFHSKQEVGSFSYSVAGGLIDDLSSNIQTYNNDYYYSHSQAYTDECPEDIITYTLGPIDEDGNQTLTVVDADGNIPESVMIDGQLIKLTQPVQEE